MTKECPLCGEFMRLVERETVSRVPGTAQEVKTLVREWVCPECDYFEEEEGPAEVPPS
jgi:C4-type Zn-finger protein